MASYMATKKVLIFNTAQVSELIGGSQSAIEDSIDLFLELDYDVTYISYKYANTSTISDNFLNRLFLTKFSRNPIYFIFDYLRILNFISFKSYNFIWSNSALPSFLFMPFLFSNNKIYTFHGPIIEEQKYYNTSFIKIYTTKILYFIFLKYFKTLHFNTTYVKNTVEKEYKFTKNYKNIVTELLVNEHKFLTKRILFDFKYYDNNFINILIPRRLVKRTGVVNFLNALLEIGINNLDKFKFHITGNGEQKNEVIDLVKLLPNVNYLDLVDESMMYYLINNANVICIPSIGAEGFCLPAKQAILLNKFVLHTGQGGLPETLYNYDKAILFDFDNLTSLKEGLFYISKNLNKNTKTASQNNYNNNFNTLFNEYGN